MVYFMNSRHSKNIILILISLALFFGATLEYAHGYDLIGIALIILAAILVSRLRFNTICHYPLSKHFVMLGIFILISDFMYNYSTNSEIGTLDTMMIIFAVSMIVAYNEKWKMQSIGIFGMWLSSVFMVLFLIFYTLFGVLDIPFLHYFDHYVIMIPSAHLAQTMGVPVKIVATETVLIDGPSALTVKVGGPCSGLYSMFLLFSIGIAYGITDNTISKTRLFSIIIFMLVVTYIANLFRTAVIIAVGFKWGLETMLFVHYHLGWIIFAVTSFLLFMFLNKYSSN